MSAKDVSLVVVSMNVLLETENQLKPVLQQHGVSLNEWSVLQAIHLGYAQSPSDVADYLNMQRASITRHVENLCIQKLLNRMYNKADRRTVQLKVTSAGKTLCRKILPHYSKIVSNVARRLEDEDRETWVSMLRAMNTADVENA